MILLLVVELILATFFRWSRVAYTLAWMRGCVYDGCITKNNEGAPMKISELKTGDKVAVVVERTSGNSVSIQRIDRVTTTQVVIGDDRYRRNDGTKVAGSRNGSWTDPIYYLRQCDDPLVKRLRTKNIMRGLVSTIGKLDTPDDVERCVGTLDEIESMVGAVRRILASL